MSMEDRSAEDEPFDLERYGDEMLERMQDPAVRDAIHEAFSTPPEDYLEKNGDS